MNMSIIVGGIGGELRLKGVELKVSVGFVVFRIRAGGRRIGGVLRKVGHGFVSIYGVSLV